MPVAEVKSRKRPLHAFRREPTADMWICGDVLAIVDVNEVGRGKAAKYKHSPGAQQESNQACFPSVTRRIHKVVTEHEPRCRISSYSLQCDDFGHGQLNARNSRVGQEQRLVFKLHRVNTI